MMGKDIERMLSGICNIIDVLESCILEVSASASYQIETTGTHGEEETTNTLDIGFLESIKSAINSMSGDLSNMSSIQSGLYVDSSSFNNSNGSPWTELSKLKESINRFTNPVSIKYMGHRVQMLGLMQVALSRAVDAKWAIITYHDYIQRAYDNKYNGNNPSIKFPGSDMGESTGNINGNYDENVHIPKKSHDPF